MTGWNSFLEYALAHGVHNGPATIRALRKVYEKHKGSQYQTIVTLFKTQGDLGLNKEYIEAMGYKRGKNPRKGTHHKKPNREPTWELTVSLPIPERKDLLLKWVDFSRFLAESVANMFNGEVEGSGVGFGFIDQHIDFWDKRYAELARKQTVKALREQGIKGYKTHMRDLRN